MLNQSDTRKHIVIFLILHALAQRGLLGADLASGRHKRKRGNLCDLLTRRPVLRRSSRRSLFNAMCAGSAGVLGICVIGCSRLPCRLPTVRLSMASPG